MSSPTMNRLGATPEEWDHFSRMLGLTGDLLPVVCDPAIPIALSSNLKKIGKTPSILRRDGQNRRPEGLDQAHFVACANPHLG